MRYLLVFLDLAKISPFILSIEKFGIHVGLFFVQKYGHIKKVNVTIEQLRWKRMKMEDDKEHGHAFWRDGEERRNVDVIVGVSGTHGQASVDVDDT